MAGSKHWRKRARPSLAQRVAAEAELRRAPKGPRHHVGMVGSGSADGLGGMVAQTAAEMTNWGGKGTRPSFVCVREVLPAFRQFHAGASSSPLAHATSHGPR